MGILRLCLVRQADNVKKIEYIPHANPGLFQPRGVVQALWELL
jgi:hypothetical protein